jgi:hypothetical protein
LRYIARRARQMKHARLKVRLARGGGGQLLGREACGEQRRAHGGRVVFAS